jgi:hypothetical protein
MAQCTEPRTTGEQCSCGDGSPIATIGRGIYPADVASARSHRDRSASISTITIALIAYAAGIATCLLAVTLVLWLKTF